MSCLRNPTENYPDKQDHCDGKNPCHCSERMFFQHITWVTVQAISLLRNCYGRLERAGSVIHIFKEQLL